MLASRLGLRGSGIDNSVVDTREERSAALLVLCERAPLGGGPGGGGGKGMPGVHAGALVWRTASSLRIEVPMAPVDAARRDAGGRPMLSGLHGACRSAKASSFGLEMSVGKRKHRQENPHWNRPCVQRWSSQEGLGCLMLQAVNRI